VEYIGFIKEIESNIRSAIKMDEMFVDSHFDDKERQLVINYLKDGQIFGGAMSCLRDKLDGEPIGPLQYYTDGKYIWPEYYPFYLSKYKNYYIPGEFLDYLKKNNFEYRSLNEEELNKIDIIFTNEWAGSYK
jgi:hypothetical protein